MFEIYCYFIKEQMELDKALLKRSSEPTRDEYIQKGASWKAKKARQQLEADAKLVKAVILEVVIRKEGAVVVFLIFPQVPEDIFLPDAETGDYVPVDVVDIQPEADDVTPEAYDKYLTAEVLILQKMAEMTKAKAKVIGRKKDADGNPIGLRNPNPLLDMRQYEVDATDVFTANLIAENVYSQVDAERDSNSIMSEIIDHVSDGSAVRKMTGRRS